MGEGRQIARNIGVLTLGRGVTALVALGTSLYLGRVLGPEGFGVLNWAIAAVGYFAFLPNMGLNVLGVRETARGADVPRLAERVFGLRLTVTLGTYALLVAVVWALPTPDGAFPTAVAYGLVFFAYTINVEWVYEGTQRMETLVVRNVVAALAALGLAVVLVRSAEDYVEAALAVAAATLLANGWLAVTYGRQYRALRPRIEAAAWRPLVSAGLPIAISLFTMQVLVSTDQVMLGLMRGEQEVGWYAAAVRLQTAALIPSQILLQSFMPSLSAAHGDRAAMRTRGEQFVTVAAVAGLCLAVGGVLFAGIIPLFFGAEYAEGVAPFVILASGLGLAYLHSAFGRSLVAWNRERWYMVAMTMGAVVNVGANAFLIPRLGVVGAAWATLAADAGILGLTAAGYWRLVGTIHVRGVLLGMAAAAGGVLVPGLLTAALPLGVRVAVVVAVSGLLLFIFLRVRSSTPPRRL